jgi:hypothetical protein
MARSRKSSYARWVAWACPPNAPSAGFSANIGFLSPSTLSSYVSTTSPP